MDPYLTSSVGKSDPGFGKLVEYLVSDKKRNGCYRFETDFNFKYHTSLDKNEYYRFSAKLEKIVYPRQRP